MPSIVESLTEKSQLQLYSTIQRMFKRAKTSNPQGRFFYNLLQNPVKDAYVKLSAEEFGVVVTMQRFYEQKLFTAPIEWELIQLFRDINSYNNVYLTAQL